MAAKEDQVLRVSKEIIVKFIETGRVSPTTFSDAFKNIYQTVSETVAQNTHEETDAEEKE